MLKAKLAQNRNFTRQNQSNEKQANINTNCIVKTFHISTMLTYLNHLVKLRHIRRKEIIVQRRNTSLLPKEELQRL